MKPYQLGGYTVYLARSTYAADGNLAVGIYNEDPEFDFLEDYGSATVNLGDDLPSGCAYADTNNLPAIDRWFFDNGLVQYTGRVR